MTKLTVYAIYSEIKPAEEMQLVRLLRAQPVNARVVGPHEHTQADEDGLMRSAGNAY